MDLILRGGNLPDGRENFDIGIEAGRIAVVEANLQATAADEISAHGRLVTPPFVDAHFHLDATLTAGRPRFNQTGTLLEGIALWEELKPTLSHDNYVARALQYCDWAVGPGLLAIRSHVDTTDPNLTGVKALLEVREQVKGYLDLQLVAFPQDGYLRSPVGVPNLSKALDLGVVVGGIPHFERTQAEGAESVHLLCEIAAERGLMVDMHCDETDDPASHHVEVLASETIRLGLQGRVTGSHLTSMHSMDNYYAGKLIGLMSDADLHIVANPTANMLLMGRQNTYPKRRGMTRVPELMQAGLNVSLGQDSVMDPWGPLNAADMLDVAPYGGARGTYLGAGSNAFMFQSGNRVSSADTGPRRIRPGTRLSRGHGGSPGRKSHRSDPTPTAASLRDPTRQDHRQKRANTNPPRPTGPPSIHRLRTQANMKSYLARFWSRDTGQSLRFLPISDLCLAPCLARSVVFRSEMHWGGW